MPRDEETALKTQWTGEQLEFHALGRRSVTGRFDGGRVSSDAGGVVLGEVDKRIGLTPRLARCFVDYRNGSSVEHDVHALVSQRIYGVALGYEDLNDHGQLRGDALLSLLVGKRDLTGEKRKRECDRGYALASSSTLNRLNACYIRVPPRRCRGPNLLRADRALPFAARREDRR